MIFIINIAELREEAEQNCKDVVENYACIKKKKPFYNIDIKGLYEEMEEKKVDKKKSFNDENELILSEEYFLAKKKSFNNSFDFSKTKTTKEKENNCEENKNNINEEGNNSLKKKNSSLINSTNSYVSESASTSGLNNFSVNSNIFSYSLSGSSINIDSSYNGSLSSSTNHFEKEPQKKEASAYNEKTKNNCKDNKLIDVPKYEENNSYEKNRFPNTKDKENNKNHGLLCKDKIINDIKKSAFLDIHESNEPDIDNCIHHDEKDLCFCGKLEEIGNEKQPKKCCQNEFMCKKCMDINKKKFNIKYDNLINIKGRVATIIQGSYHCFGPLLFGNQTEYCISKSCEACKLLDSYSKYYL